MARDSSGRRVPTLTEVIFPPTTVDLLLELPAELPSVEAQSPQGAPSGSDAGEATDTMPFTKDTIPSISALLASVDYMVTPPEEDTPLARVLADLQRQLDAGLEARMREVLGAAMARAAESAIRETSEQLTQAMREAVERALAQELARHRDR